MATVTPNFNWPVPTSTDLVKDGATAIEALGDSIDASLVDLKGGTTGQVLSKASNTDMDFTWVTNADGDITGVTAGTGLTGGGTSGTVTISFDVANFGGGQGAAGKNATINGGMDIWQRGTSISLAAGTSAANGFTTDRWFLPTGTNQASTVSRQSVNDSTNLPNIQYCARLQRNSGQTGTAAMALNYNFETANSIPFAGKTITVSFYARAGANYSPTSSVLASQLYTGTGTDQNIQVGGFTGQTLAVNQNNTLTTTWQRFTYTYAVPSTVTQFAYIFLWTPTGTAGTNDYFELTGVQMEAGSTATPFTRAAGNIQAELAACQRYYQKSYNQSVTPGTASQVAGAKGFQNAGALATGSVVGGILFGITMRVAPTISTWGYAGGTSRVSNGSGTDLASGSASAIWIGESGFAIQNSSGGSVTPDYNVLQCHYAASAEL